ncbi:MAG: TRAP transporter substrate-binding protein [Gemmatimonadetes bacterium]|nr:TRAP transporter substrate-binding protein [Gemmatimonadota bacterium]
MKTNVLPLVLVLAWPGCGGGGGADSPIELRFGHVGAPGSLFAVTAEEFARRANERLGDRAKVIVFGSSQLGGDDVMLQKLKLGTVDLVLPSTIMSSIVEAFGLFEMPYLLTDREHMRRVEEEVFWPDLHPLAVARGYEVLAIWENGFRHVTNNVRPITDPEDLHGIKLRTPRGIWRVKMFQALGANPTPMPLSEVFVALQTGSMDGQENPLAQIVAARLHEVQSFLSLTGHVYTPAYVTVGTERWAKLPEDVRTILRDTAREMQEFAYATAERMDPELLEDLRNAGIVINEPDQDAFVTASSAVYDEFAASVANGGELIDRVLALATR